MTIDPTTFAFLIPEILLVVLATIVIVGSAFARSTGGWIMLTLAAMFAAGVALFRVQGPPWYAVNEAWHSGPLISDALANSMRWLSLAVGFLLVIILARRAQRTGDGEGLGMLLFVTAGMMLVCAASDLVLLFVGFELISIPTYVLLYVGRHDEGSAEASVKYFFLSVLSSAALLLSFSLIYGAAGSTEFATIANQINGAADGTPPNRLLLLALVFAFAGLGFKLAVVPFHFYAPDVYAATTNANAGLLAVVPKIAGVVGLLRVLELLAPIWPSFAWQLALVISIATMTLGNVCALWQSNIRRMMAYSSIAHAGYLLIGLSVGLAGGPATSEAGFSALLLYLFVYSIASLGTFAVLSELSDLREINSVDQLSGLARRRSVMAAALGIFMFSLAGIPPLAGFWGKLTLFTGALASAGSENAGMNVLFLALAVVGAVNAAIAAAYYLRVVAAVYFQDGGRDIHTSVGLSAIAAVACAVLVVAAGLFPGRVVDHYRHVGHTVAAVTPRQPPRDRSATTSIPPLPQLLSGESHATPHVP